MKGQPHRGDRAKVVEGGPLQDQQRRALPGLQQAGIAGMDKDILCRILQPRTEIFTQIPEVVDFLIALPEYDAELFTNKKSKTDSVVSAEVLDFVSPALEALPQQWEAFSSQLTEWKNKNL